MLTSTTPTRSMVWTFPPEFDRADFQATRTLKGWILYKSHSGSSCTRACTIPGFVGLHTEEKPSSFRLTTSALQYLWLNWYHNCAPAMWIWTNLLPFELARQANVSTRRKQPKTWPKTLLNFSNLGSRLNHLRTWRANNAFLNWRQNWPRSNRPALLHRVRHLRALLRPRHRLDAHFKDNLPPLRPSILRLYLSPRAP